MTFVGSTAPAFEFCKFRVREINVAAIDLARACDLIGQLAIKPQWAYVTVTGAHGIVESVYDERIREAHQQASLVVPDGMPLVWLGGLLGFNSIGRVYGPDLMAAIFARRELRQLRHYFYGSTPATIDKLTTALTSRFGEFNLVGTHSPPFRPVGSEEDEDVLSHIRQLKPHIIWVGLSTPKQEIWLHDHMPKIGCGVGIGVGAAFDLVSGTTRQAPRWVQRSGLEWLYRLATEPRRLFRRYLFIVPRFFYYMVETLITSRAQSSDKPE